MSVLRPIGNNSDYLRWLTLWDDSPDREPWAHPDYVRLFARECDATIALVGDENGYPVLPLIQRPLVTESWASPYERTCDLTSPYGYGGPFGDLRNIHQIWPMLESFASTANAVSSFIRLSLSVGPASLPKRVRVSEQSNIVVSLAGGTQGIWHRYEYKVRKNVRRATREGVTIELDSDGARMDDFLSVYHDTLSRRAAPLSYRHSADFFSALRRALGGHIVWFHAIHGGRVVASESVLLSESSAYSHLGGTLASAFAVRPNDLLKHEIILWAHARGLSDVVLGGGVHHGDGIYQYKRSFAPSGVVAFRTVRYVHDKEQYERLSRQREEYELRTDNVGTRDANFFPAYRSS